MKKIAAELLVERLIEWGVDTVFGLPGDGINGIMEALRRHRDRINFVLVHHEEAAAFMATGYAKATGRLGVCLATSGPGGIHLLNGLYDAKLDHQPVLALTGMQELELLGTGYQQEVHLEKLYMDVAEYDVMVHTPVQIPTLVDFAVKHALAHRTVSHITFPNDVQLLPADTPAPDGPAPAHRPETLPHWLPEHGVPRRTDLERAAAVLNEGSKVAILAGAGAIGAAAKLRDVAERLAAPIAKTLSGKACYPDDDEYAVGGIGLLGTLPGESAMEQCDTLFMVGSNFPFTKHLPEHARTVQIDISPVRAGNRVPTEVPLVGDARETLTNLLPLLKRKTDRSFIEGRQREMKDWWRRMDAVADPDRDPIQPQYLMRLIDRHASGDAMLCADSGTIAAWSARHWTIRGGRGYMLSGNLATMAPGLPYAIAAQHAFPGRQCIAFVGDGGFSMLMAEILTAVRHDLPVKVFINNNHAYGEILWEQMVLGYPEYAVRHRSIANYASFADANGIKAYRVEHPDQLEQAVTGALEHPGPALVDCLTNPDEPPMPAKVSYEMAKGFAESFLHGQPNRRQISTTLLKDKIAELKG
ncbi:MAG TPA: thiamine pyrophosphate-dependent enzyme [Candidatus Dormibacteraeota bacterium]|nr:thiamine pyrophosphate-dependent enzyme [Candidatus Dormibacteraeota bacterium]